MSTVTQTKTTTGTTAAPGNSLANTNGNNFLLFNSDWLKLQSFITSCMQMPITQGDFATKYGTFSDETLIENCVSAMKQVQALGTVMGDPSSLQKKISSDPNYVSGKTAPAEIYAHCIWLAGQLNETASTFNMTWSSLSEMYTGSASQNASTLKEILTGEGGLQSSAQTMLTYTQALQKKLADFQTNFDTAEKVILTYCDKDSKVLADAQKDVTVDTSSISSLQNQASEAHSEWEKYTIAATTASIGIAVISMGILWPVAAGVGGGLGAAAANEMALYNKLTGEIRSDQVDLQKKTRLVTDLTSFNLSMAKVSGLLTSFASALETIEGVWLDQNQKLTHIAGLDDNTLGDLPTVMQKLDVLNAQKAWGVIATNTSKFTTNSLVNYLSNIKYPAPIPAQN